MKLTCLRCRASYVDPSPAAMVEPKACPWCSHNTATPSFGVPSIEDLRRALDEMDAIVPPAPRVDFYAVPGSTDVAVLADDVPIKVLTAAQFEEVKRRLKEGNGR